jgi:hypothetical protein
MDGKEIPMLTVKARFDGHAFIPEQPVNLPAGSVVEIPLPQTMPPLDNEPPLARLAEIASLFPDDPDMPTDAAAQVDHYLYGLPKRP